MILNEKELELLEKYSSKDIKSTLKNLEIAKHFASELEKNNINNLIKKLTIKE